MIDLSAHRVVKITAQRNWYTSCQVVELKITNDEGQDFNNIFWNNVERLKMSKSFALHVFMDSNPSVYRSPEDIASRLQAKRFTLRLNLRNTQSISKLTSNLYSGPLMYTVGPMGSKPEIYSASNIDDAIELILRL